MRNDGVAVEKIKASRRPLFKNLLSTLRHHRKPGSSQATSSPTSSTASPVATPITPSPHISANSLTRTSTKSSSNPSEADGDASIRPITPASIRNKDDTASIGSSSHISTQHTANSVSTKPTTLPSQASDSGANRIAVARSSGVSDATSSPINPRMPMISSRRDSATTDVSTTMPSSASIQFSSLPTSPSTPLNMNENHVPGHTLPNPKNNPHPASPALDNASTITLASSTGMGAYREGSLYQARIDENASIRALPPSRRESSSSLNSKYSGAILSNAAVPTSTSYPPSLRDHVVGTNPVPRPASLRSVATTRSGQLVSALKADQRKSAGTVEELAPATNGIQHAQPSPPITPTSSAPVAIIPLEAPISTPLVDPQSIALDAQESHPKTENRMPNLQRNETEYSEMMHTAPSTPLDAPPPNEGQEMRF